MGYMDQISVPYWRVDFKSGSTKGDIVVRASKSLDSEEVAVLFYDARVEQAGPQEPLQDGIVRMPVFYSEAGKSKPRIGWVTCDATSQGGPKFFEPWTQTSEDAAENNGPMLGAGSGHQGSWDKNRMWKVVNLESGGAMQLPLVNRVEPFAPNSKKQPPEEIVLKWLENDDVLEQVGHSKKMRGFMVMPVRTTGCDQQDVIEGWVTRRLIDKAREGGEESWLEEIREDGRTRRKG